MDIVILIIGFVLTEGYTIYIKRSKKYGLQKSISASARLIQDKEGRSPLFVVWVLVLAFPVAYVSNQPLCWLGACIMSIIGGFTGFNINFWNKKLQQNIHTASVLIAIVLFEWGLYLIDSETLEMIIAILPFILLSAILKYKGWIWYSEQVVKYQIYLTLLIISL